MRGGLLVAQPVWPSEQDFVGMVGFFSPHLLEFWGSNSSFQACQPSTFTHWVIFLALGFSLIVAW